MEAFQLIPLGSIDPSPTNPRKKFDPDGLAELAESIKAKGMLQAVLVRPRLSAVASNKAERTAKAKPSANGHAGNGKPKAKKRQPAGV